MTSSIESRKVFCRFADMEVTNTLLYSRYKLECCQKRWALKPHSNNKQDPESAIYWCMA